MSSDNLALEQHDSITVVRLNRPPANALCLELAREFETMWESPGVKDAAALVLTGTGRFFSGGLDLKSVPSYSTAEQRDFLHVLNRMVARLYACPVPLVGAINGHAVAGAFVLALTTDYRVGPTGNAQLGLTEARVGSSSPLMPCSNAPSKWPATWRPCRPTAIGASSTRCAGPPLPSSRR